MARRQTSGSDSSVEFEVGHGRWMERLFDKICDWPLNKVAIPGSHDCFSGNLTTAHYSTDPTGRKWRGFAPYLRPEKFVAGWSATQEISVTEQLDMGVRYLDVRVCAVDGDVYSCHCLCGPPIRLLLREVAAFLRRTEKEIVMIDFNHFYTMNDTQHAILLADIREILGDFLIDRGKHRPTSSVKEFIASNVRIIHWLEDFYDLHL